MQPFQIPPRLASVLLICSYGQALAAVAASRSELDRLGIPHRRPDDYFAEMMKSDQHMQKVRQIGTLCFCVLCAYPHSIFTGKR